MQRYFGTARDTSGRAIAGAQATVYVSGTSTLATIYNASDSNDTPSSTISNPITTDANGNFGFAAINGDYDVVVSGGTFGTLIYPRVNLFDGSSTAAVTAAGSTNQVQYNSGGALAASANLVFDPSAKRLTLGGTGTPFNFTASKYLTYDTANTFIECEIQNLSNGASASADHVATADTGTDTTNFVDMGINSSGWADGTWTINGALGSYLYCNGGDLAIGTATAAKNILFFTGGTLAANERVRITSGGMAVTGVVNVTNAMSCAAINFGGANSLSNYTEGTWTPVMQGTTGTAGAYAAAQAVGSYTRIGRMVFATMRLQLSNKGSWTGNMFITGLPLNPAPANTACSLGWLDNTTFAGSLTSYVTSAGQIWVTQNATGAADTVIPMANVANNTDILISLAYNI